MATDETVEPRIIEALLAKGFAETRDQMGCRDFLRRAGVIRKKISSLVDPKRPWAYHGIKQVPRRPHRDITEDWRQK